MKTIFKKTLVAVAVLGLSTNAFADVDLVGTNTSVMYSTQTLDGLTNASVTNSNFVITLGAEYAVGDIITLTFSNDALVAGQLKSTITTSTALTANGNTGVNASGAQVTLGLLSQTATSATYRVTEVSTGATTVGQKFTVFSQDVGGVIVAPVTLNAAKVKAGNGFKVSYAAQTSNGIVIDASSTKSSFQLVYTTDQFAMKADPLFDGVIDVANDRKQFDPAATTDTATFTLTNKPTQDPDGTGPLTALNLVSPVAFNEATLVIKGDFSWVKDSNTTDAGIQAAAATLNIPAAACTAAATTGATANVTWAVDKVTIVCDTNAGDEVTGVNPIAVTLNTAQGGAAVVIPASTFTYDATLKYAATKTASYASGLSAGSWTLNGSSVFVPYMVYGTLNEVSYGQVINVANNSSKVGDIKVDAWNEDGTVLLSNVKVGEAKANTVTSIAGAVRTALNGAGLVNGKVSMKITTNVPGKAVTVYSAYVDGVTRERAIVNNDSAVQTKGAALN